MSFGGHVLDMIKKNNQNEALRRSRRESRRKSSAKSILNSNKIVYPKISKEKLQKIKAEIRVQFKRERRIRTVKTIVISTIILVIIFYGGKILLVHITGC